jgi:hypothetical protein
MCLRKRSASNQWRNQFSGLKADDAKRLKELKRENSHTKCDHFPGPATPTHAERLLSAWALLIPAKHDASLSVR